jgi:hypothetical protein
VVPREVDASFRLHQLHGVGTEGETLTVVNEENIMTTHTITYTLDDEPQTTLERELTARQILVNGGIDPASHYLKQIQGAHDKEKKSYKDTPDEIIHLHPNLQFISVSTGPTTVS